MNEVTLTPADREAASGPAGAAAEPRWRASDLLLDLAHQREEKVTFGDVMDRLGDRTFGFVLLLLAILCCLPQPPGAATVLGAALMLVAVQLMIGRHQPWLPASLKRRGLSRATFRAGVTRIAPTMRRIERLCKPRLSWLTVGLFERLAGLVTLVLAFVITMPIPVIGNVLPGLAVAVMAMSLIEHDGYAFLAGVGLAIAALAILGALVGGTALAILN